MDPESDKTSQLNPRWTTRLGTDRTQPKTEGSSSHSPVQHAPVNAAVDSVNASVQKLKDEFAKLSQQLNTLSSKDIEPAIDAVLEALAFKTGDDSGRLVVLDGICNHCAKAVSKLKTFIAELKSIPPASANTNLGDEAAHFYHPAGTIADLQVAASRGCHACAWNHHLLRESVRNDRNSAAQGVWATSVSHWQTSAFFPESILCPREWATSYGDESGMAHRVDSAGLFINEVVKPSSDQHHFS